MVFNHMFLANLININNVNITKLKIKTSQGYITSNNQRISFITPFDNICLFIAIQDIGAAGVFPSYFALNGYDKNGFNISSSNISGGDTFDYIAFGY